MKNLNDVTVFVIDYGNNPNLEDVFVSLNNQTCTFKKDIIKDITPMGAAFQQMIDRCETKYFIQVDSDMVLYSNAIETLYNFILKSSEKEAMIGCMLKDVHLDRPIVGIKIYKTEIMKKYPYTIHHPSVEMGQLEKLTKDGYTFDVKGTVIGDHSPKWTKELIFTRYYTLMEKYKIYKYGWISELPKKLLKQVQTNPTEWNIYALLGIMASLSKKEITLKERNYAETLIEYKNLLEFLK
jgi:hypothetical protein